MCRFSEQHLHLCLLAPHNRGLGSILLTFQHNSLSDTDLSGHTGQWFAQFAMYVDRCALGMNLGVYLS